MLRKQQLPEVEPVKLKPFHGIRPGVYILIFWALVVLLISFFLFVLPGLASDTSYITFNEPIVGSGVLEDGIYLGSGNDGVYKTSSGHHVYTFIYEGEEYGRIETNLKRRVLFTLFSHKPVLIEPERSYSDGFKDKVESAFIRDVSLYSAVIDPPSSFHYPPLFSAFASNAVEAGIKDVSSVWLLSMAHITSSVLYDDYLEGKDILLDNGVLFETEDTLILDKTLSSLYGGEGVKLLKTMENTIGSPSVQDDYFSYGKTKVEMGYDTTLSIENVKEAPIVLDVDGFSIAKNLVTEHDWALFVSSNPMWAKDNLDELIAKGLVDDNYLKGITLSPFIYSIRPIRNISYHAAEAYVAWKSEVDKIQYHIPTEGEWYTAALSAKDKDYVTSLVYIENNPTSPTAMLGQLWEFTSTPYIPLSRVSDYDRLIELSALYNSDDVIIKGGSYVSDPASISIDSVGITSKSMCSEFCGLRLAK